MEPAGPTAAQPRMSPPAKTRPARPRVEPEVPRMRPRSMRITSQSPAELGWPTTHEEQARLAAQRDATAKTRAKDVLIYAVPHGHRAPIEILSDARWEKRKKPVTVLEFKTGRTLQFDIYQAWILALTGQVVAEGPAVWKKMLEIMDQLKPAEIRFGHVLDGTVRPFDRFAKGRYTIVFLTTKDGDIWYYDGRHHCIRATSYREFLNTIVWGAFAKAAQSAEGMLVLYRSMIHFAAQVIPYGRSAQKGVKAASLLVFWDNHRQEIEACYELIEGIIKSMRTVYQRAPRLGVAMLRLAAEQSAFKLEEAVKKDGIVKVIVSNLDGEKLAQYVAELFGILFKVATDHYSASGIAAKIFEKLGLKALSRIASTVNNALKVWGALGRITTGGGVKDKQELATAFMKQFAAAGVKLTEDEAAAILAEGGHRDEQVVRAVQKLDEACRFLEPLVKKLSDEAKKRLF